MRSPNPRAANALLTLLAASGAARGAPACVDLKTYPVKVEDGKVFLQIG